MRKVRAPVVDEIFYPADSQELEAQVRALLQRSPVAEGEAGALVLPHAAYSLVGGVLAAGFRAVARRAIKRVVILAPMHRDPGAGIVLPESAAFLTPLGEIAVDAATLAEMGSWSTAIVSSDMPHLEEHSIETCLPFVQVLFPGASLVPVLVGRAPDGLIQVVGQALTAALADRWGETLFLATSNLNGDAGGLKEANAFLSALGAGRAGRRLLAATRAASILQGARSGRITACGAHAVAALLGLQPAAGLPRLLARGDSGREAPRRKYYGAVALG